MLNEREPLRGMLNFEFWIMNGRGESSCAANDEL
jgi:hypothetical protein